MFWSIPLVASPNAQADAYEVAGVPLYGKVVSDAAIRDRVTRLGGTWRRRLAIQNGHGDAVASIWRRADGSIFLPFDPDEMIWAYLSERYRTLLRQRPLAKLEGVGRRAYYRLRPLLPRAAQTRVRRSYSRVQARTPFPTWPIETALHDLYRFLFSVVSEIATEPVPVLAPWPRGFQWAFVLTHDVEGAVGQQKLVQLLEVERLRGYRSSWNFVPENASTDETFLDELRRSGFEVGVHGLYHDGRDLASPRAFRRRLPRIREYAERWKASGFRSPATIRSWELMRQLDFDYDSSYSDTAPFEPQPGGCCSWLPFMIGDLVELPITLPQDHTLFEILGHPDGRLWRQKTRFLRDRGGMALILTHPDYIGNKRLLASYVDFLDEFANDETAWRVLPRDVSAWWRRRAATTLQRVDGEWTLHGPAAAEAAIEFVHPSSTNA
jgi:hypothetical protein